MSSGRSAHLPAGESSISRDFPFAAATVLHHPARRFNCGAAKIAIFKLN
jgi:hypothetical protein